MERNKLEPLLAYRAAIWTASLRHDQDAFYILSSIHVFIVTAGEGFALKTLGFLVNGPRLFNSHNQ